MEITKPLYENSHDINGQPAFNVMFYKLIDSTYLSLSQARQYFVGLSGYNTIDAYNYFTNSIYSIADIACSYFSSQSITTNRLVCHSIVCVDIEAQNYNIPTKPILYINGLSIPLDNRIITNDYVLGLDIMVLLSSNVSSCLLAPLQNITVYDTSNSCIFNARNTDKAYRYFTIPILKNPNMIKIKN